MSETTALEGLRHLGSGKVRELYAIGEDRLLLVASDRLSAFDVVMPTPIPNKGAVLTGLSLFWFDSLAGIVANHLITADAEAYPAELAAHRDWLRKRSMLVRRARVVPIECVARGYLSGSGWKEYRQTGEVCGVRLPGGLRESDKLPEPIFTPSTKAGVGHDENVSEERAAEIVGAEVVARLRDLTLALYSAAAAYAATRGIIIADTKFEFGVVGEDLILVDEALTPDSSRFWPADSYRPGGAQPSFDKQYVRDWLETSDWDKTPPGPELPAGVVDGTAARYAEAYERITGRSLKDYLES
ncbi:MAG: phosphoribosylaminoimidazolesuccinocarboxamide synthase [Actinomycetota bacterium]